MKHNEGKSSTCKVYVTAFMFLMSLCLLLRFSCYYIQLPAFYSKVLSKVCRYSWYTQLTTVTTTEMKAPLRTLFAAVVVTHVSLKLTATKSSSRATEAVILQVAAVYFFCSAKLCELLLRWPRKVSRAGKRPNKSGSFQPIEYSICQV